MRLTAVLLSFLLVFAPASAGQMSLLGAGGQAPSLGPATVTYRTNAQVSSPGGVNTGQATALNIVNAAADLLLVAGLTANEPGNSIVSATITPNGGSPISASVVGSPSSTSMFAVLLQFSIPNGTDLTNATFDVTLTNTIFSALRVGFWTVPTASLLSTTAVDFKTSGGSATSASVTTLVTSSGGILVAVGTQSGFETATWTGTDSPTEDYDAVYSGATDHTGASKSNIGASGGSTVTVTFTGSAAATRIAAASWR